MIINMALSNSSYQSVYLTDGAIASNIALGVPEGSIDIKKKQKLAAKKAQISEFIESIPSGY